MEFKPTGRATSIPVGIAWSALTSLSVTMIGCGILAWAINKETIPWEETGYAIMIIVITASFLGASAACKRIKRKRLMVCAIAAGIYMLELLSMTALFFHGQYDGVGETGLLILCGSMLCVLWESRKRRGHTYKKHAMAHR